MKTHYSITREEILDAENRIKEIISDIDIRTALPLVCRALLDEVTSRGLPTAELVDWYTQALLAEDKFGVGG